MGKRNGSYRHGMHTVEAVEVRRETRQSTGRGVSCAGHSRYKKPGGPRPVAAR